MKELSIEDKAKRYDEAIPKLKGLLEGIHEEKCDIMEEDITNIFPELKESEDEGIRKEIITYLYNELNNIAQLTPRTNVLERWVAWLEKQGEKGTNGNEREIPISEQKPADKVEPKFKVGDFIKHNRANIICKVISVNSGSYYVRSIHTSNGIELFKAEQNFHLWTIQDAKDGDVLQLGEVTAIFEAFTDNEKCECYCYCSVYNGEFEIPSQEGDDNIYGCHNAIPATKEQRELLFQKMKEAGYEWDAAMKELKKIEHNPAWSEEDEYCLAGAIETELYMLDVVNGIKKFDVGNSSIKEECTKELNWLKSLKDRVQPQPKQEWSEEDEKNLMK